jgi:hypothetical protein
MDVPAHGGDDRGAEGGRKRNVPVLARANTMATTGCADPGPVHWLSRPWRGICKLHSLGGRKLT